MNTPGAVLTSNSRSQFRRNLRRRDLPAPAGVLARPQGREVPAPDALGPGPYGATAPVARGNAGAAALIGPTSLMSRFMIPRAGLPVNTFVRAVWWAASLFSAARWTALVVASGHSRYASFRM
jgi:hypothetical protein